MQKIRSKSIRITAMLAVMVAMTGIAAADFSENASPGSINLVSGGTNTSTITYTGIAGNTQINWWLENDNGSPATEIQASASGDYASSGNYLASSGVGKLFTIKDLAGGNTESKYWLVTCIYDNCRRYSVSVEVNFIPEFPTVALPVAAVIGLVFFFQNRKKKEKE